MTITQRIAFPGLLVFSILAGCSEKSQVSDPSGIPDAGALSGLQNELSLMGNGGVDLGSSRGVFSLRWDQMFDPRSRQAVTIGHALAVAFDSSRAQTRPPRGGIDIGSVSLAYGGSRLDLQKRTGRDGGIIYASGMEPHDTSGANIAFIGGAAYEFQVSGSGKFSAMSAAVTAPAALLQISSPLRGAVVSAASDLQLTWSGGTPEGKVLIELSPAPESAMGGGHRGPGPMGPGGGGMQGPPPGGGMMNGTPPPGGGMMPPPPGEGLMHGGVVIKLDSNPGQYTITALQLQQALKYARSTSRLAISVGQMQVAQLDHDGGKVLLVLQNGDLAVVRTQ